MDWNMFMLALTYAKHKQLYRYIRKYPFRWELMQTTKRVAFEMFRPETVASHVDTVFVTYVCLEIVWYAMLFT